jgi:A/G-specific adenine glycosylase
MAYSGRMAMRERDLSEIESMRGALLGWYALHRRDLPWRRTSDPYAIWVSEIMLQQTRVAVVIERYQAFMARFPTVASLALANEQDVLALWSGLGYYRRARMLHKAAQAVAELPQRVLPPSSAELRKLAGIGAYTAAAIASIAYGEAIAVVDGNVERVVARLVDPSAPGDFNQAMMELGATVCLPRNPQCLVCPLLEHCKTQGEHKTKPRARMLTREAAYALCLRARRGGKKADYEVLLEQRPAALTVMPGLWELPALKNISVPEDELRMTVRHAIMQVNYLVRIRNVVEADEGELTLAGGERRWVPLAEAATIALTGLARKVLARAHLLGSAAPQAG